jgi:hypothetical protein
MHPKGLRAEIFLFAGNIMQIVSPAAHKGMKTAFFFKSDLTDGSTGNL